MFVAICLFRAVGYWGIDRAVGGLWRQFGTILSFVKILHEKFQYLWLVPQGGRLLNSLLPCNMLASSLPAVEVLTCPPNLIAREKLRPVTNNDFVTM